MNCAMPAFEFTAKRVETRDAFMQALKDFHPDIILFGLQALPGS